MPIHQSALRSAPHGTPDLCRPQPRFASSQRSPATMECISGETGISPSISVPANCSTIRLAPREHNRPPSCSIARTPPILSLFHRTPTELPTPRSPKPARKSFFVNRLPLPLPASNGYDNTVGLQRCRKIRARSLAACFRLLVQ
jgi:hypothetical protein